MSSAPCAASPSPTATRRCSRTCRWRCGAARSSRSPARTARARRLWRSSPPGCSSRTRVEVVHAPAAFLTRIPDGISSPSACWTRSRSAPTRPARAPSWRVWAWPHLVDRHPRDLSVGERERLVLAAVLATDPDLLVLDEPTRGVDPERKAELAALLRSDAPRRGTIVVTHDLPWAVARRRPGRRAAVARGRACLGSSPSRAALFAGALLAPNGALATLLARAALVAAGVAWFESGPDSTRELALVATLGAAAAAGRVLFAAIPGVQPVTVVTVVAGVALGLRAGVAVGALAAFVSNLFLGQGVWTPQQMLGWARVRCGRRAVRAGASLALCARRGDVRARARLQRADGRLALVRASSRIRAPRSPPSSARGLWFDVSHAVGNVVIALAIGPELLRMLERYGTKLRAVIVWAAEQRVVAAPPARRLAGAVPAGSRSGRRVRRAAAGPPTRHSRRGRCSGWRRGGDRAGLARVPAGAGVDARSRRPTSRSSRWPRRRSARSRRHCSIVSASAARPSGQIGPTVNSTCWAVLALGRSTRGDDALAPRAAGAERGVRVGDPRAAGLERHRGGAGGAAGRRRARSAG